VTVERAAPAPAALAWIPGGPMPASEWLTQGRRILAVGRAWRWWLGDWLLFGERYHARHLEELDLGGHDPATVAACMDVARRFPPAARRAGLAWGHHAAVVVLDDQEAERLLDRAERDGLRVADLRALVGGEPIPSCADIVGQGASTPEGAAAPDRPQGSRGRPSGAAPDTAYVPAVDLERYVVEVQILAESLPLAEARLRRMLARAPDVTVCASDLCEA